MREIIYAKSATESILDKFNEDNRVHSIFNNGINLKGKDGLVFIGTSQNGQLPFGIHVDGKSMESLKDIDNNTIFKFNRSLKILFTEDHIIDFSKAYFYKSKLPGAKNKIGKRELNYLVNIIREKSFVTGLDMTIKDMISDNKGLIYKLRTSIDSKDEKYNKEILRTIIGRGKGLTPSGDDLLIGLLWVNEIKEILGIEFLNSLKELILQGGLTTDVSINYYKSAFIGDYSSKLIDLCYELIEFNEEKIKVRLQDIIQYGHTSGVDILSGIALGLDIII